MAIDTPRSAASASAPAAVLRTAILLRALPLIVVGLVITFSADHSTAIGFVMLSVLGLASGASLGLGALRLPAGDALRGLHLGLATLAVIVGVLSLALSSRSLGFLLLLVGAYAAFGGLGELVWGIRRRTAHPVARDAIVVGAATAALAVVTALVGDPVSAVGFFGAYAIIAGVFLVIAGLSVGGAAPIASPGAAPGIESGRGPGTASEKENSPS